MVPRALQNEQQIKQEMLPNSSKFHHVHMSNDLCLSFQTDHGTDWVCRSYKQMTVSNWILHGDVIACGPWGMPWFSTVWLQLPCIEITSITYNASQLCRVKEILTKHHKAWKYVSYERITKAQLVFTELFQFAVKSSMCTWMHITCGRQTMHTSIAAEEISIECCRAWTLPGAVGKHR